MESLWIQVAIIAAWAVATALLWPRARQLHQSEQAREKKPVQNTRTVQWGKVVFG